MNPDSRWSVYNINSAEEFQKRIFIKGKFHKGVPDKIKGDFIRVEKLLEFAYYYFPFIDEAFSKSTRVFESSITYKIEELNLDPDKKLHNLSLKIDKLAPFTTEKMLAEWKATKEIRNIFAHERPGNLYGMAIHRAFKQIINNINSVFLTKEYLDSLSELYNNLSNAISSLQGPFILIHNGSKILIDKIVAGPCIKTENGVLSLVVFYPILKTFPHNMESLAFPKPIFHHLCNPVVDTISISAKGVNSYETIIVEATDNPDNLEKFEKFHLEINNSETQVKEVLESYYSYEYNVAVANFIYNHYWQ